MDRPLSRRALLAGSLLAPALPVTDAGQAAPTLADVPMFRGNAARTGENPGPGPASQPGYRWSTRLGKVLSSSPAVAGGMVYIGSVSSGTAEGGALHAVEAATGVEAWRLGTEPGDGIIASPAVAGGIVVVGSYDGIVIAADAATGDERWRFQAAESIYSSPAIVDGVVFIADTGAHLHALDAASGEVRWQVVSGNGLERAFATPAVADGVVYCVDAPRRAWEAHWLHAWDAATGEERWRHAPGAGTRLAGTAVVAGGRVFVLTRDTEVRVVDAFTGEAMARLDHVDTAHTDIAVVDEVLYVGTETGVLQAIDARTGERRWGFRYIEDGELLSPPTVAGDTVYVGDTAGGIHAIDIATGDPRWDGNVGSLRSAPAITGGLLFIGDNVGALHAVGDVEG